MDDEDEEHVSEEYLRQGVVTEIDIDVGRRIPSGFEEPIDDLSGEGETCDKILAENEVFIICFEYFST